MIIQSHLKSENLSYLTISRGIAGKVIIPTIIVIKMCIMFFLRPPGDEY